MPLMLLNVVQEALQWRVRELEQLLQVRYFSATTGIARDRQLVIIRVNILKKHIWCAAVVWYYAVPPRSQSLDHQWKCCPFSSLEL